MYNHSSILHLLYPVVLYIEICLSPAHVLELVPSDMSISGANTTGNENSSEANATAMASKPTTFAYYSEWHSTVFHVVYTLIGVFSISTSRIIALPSLNSWPYTINATCAMLVRLDMCNDWQWYWLLLPFPPAGEKVSTKTWISFSQQTSVRTQHPAAGTVCGTLYHYNGQQCIIQCYYSLKTTLAERDRCRSQILDFSMLRLWLARVVLRKYNKIC